MLNEYGKTSYCKKLREYDEEEEEEANELLLNSLDHTVYIEKTNENKYKYKLKILVGSFIPTDFKLKLKGKNLLIRATREAIKHDLQSLRDDDNQDEDEDEEEEYNYDEDYEKNINLKEYEEFKRELTLPDFVLTNSIICYLEVYEDNQNFLYIEALVDDSADFNSMTHYQTKQQRQQSPGMQPYSRRSNCTNQSLRKRSTLDKKTFQSIDQLNEKRVENYSSNGCLKYKFELKEFESNNVSISIKNQNILVVYAFTTYLDLNGKPALKEFNKEIPLPDNIELCNIRNCFDESVGTLRIEIPLIFNKSNNNAFNQTVDVNHNNDDHENEKYLELIFDLKDFKFESASFIRNEEDKNVLIVKASKINLLKNKNSCSSPFIRKYVLPGKIFVKIFSKF